MTVMMLHTKYEELLPPVCHNAEHAMKRVECAGSMFVYELPYMGSVMKIRQL